MATSSGSGDNASSATTVSTETVTNLPAPMLLIVGMHRSGTSLLGSILPACGIAMPGALIPSDKHNPEGYFEREDVTELQEQLLIDLDRWWPSPRGIEALPQGWLESDRGQKALTDLVKLLEPECRQQKGPWAIKDPRSSLLLPLWKAACMQLKIPLQLLLAVRDPSEVMVSLVARDRFVTGMDGWRAQQLWWIHNAHVLNDGMDLPLRVVSYSNWFKPELAHRQLKNVVPDCRDNQHAVALAAVKPEHRRSFKRSLPEPVSKELHEFNRHLQGLALTTERTQFQHKRQQLERWLAKTKPQQTFRGWILGGGPVRQPKAGKDWTYLAGLLWGSPGRATQKQLKHWLQNGFTADDFAGFRVLPGSIPNAESWSTTEDQIDIQLRGSKEQCKYWLDACPVKPASLRAVPFGSANAHPVALNVMDLQAGASGAADLLKLAALQRVWDPDRQRVQLLRQFGVRASWLQKNVTEPPMQC